MGFFTRKKHTIPDECIYDPYFDLESEIVSEVKKVIKKGDIGDELPDYENFIRNNDEMKKHLLKMFEIAEGCDEMEIACFLMVARRDYPNLWHVVNAKADSEMRSKLQELEKLIKGENK